MSYVIRLNLQILSKDSYKYIKRIIINYMVEGEDVEFVTTDISEDKEA